MKVVDGRIRVLAAKRIVPWRRSAETNTLYRDRVQGSSQITVTQEDIDDSLPRARPEVARSSRVVALFSTEAVPSLMMLQIAKMPSNT